MPTIDQCMGGCGSAGALGSDSSALQAAQGARHKFPEHLIAVRPRHSGADELCVHADEEERGAVVGADIVVEFAAVSRALDLGGEQHEGRMFDPGIVHGACRRKVPTDHIAEYCSTPAGLECDDEPDDLVQYSRQVAAGFKKSAQLLGEIVLIASDQIQQDMFFGGEMEVEGTAGNSCRLHDRVDVRRICAGTLEFHDGGIQYPRPRLAALGFATRRSVWHVSYSAASGQLADRYHLKLAFNGAGAWPRSPDFPPTTSYFAIGTSARRLRAVA